jgi:hypothetical protein
MATRTVVFTDTDTTPPAPPTSASDFVNSRRKGKGRAPPPGDGDPWDEGGPSDGNPGGPPDDDDDDDASIPGDLPSSDSDNGHGDSASVPASVIGRVFKGIIRELRNKPNSRRSKVNPPDTFDGTDALKINSFITQCNLVFKDSSEYADDASKVNYALSYLRGTALEYFQPVILGEDTTFYPWTVDWEAFVDTIRSEFGAIDPAGEAQSALLNIKMHDNQRLIKYNVEFARHAGRSGWNDGALAFHYYTGLPDRIKDVMVSQGKPGDLRGLKKKAAEIDSRHWERAREKNRHASRSSAPKSDPNDRNSASASSSNNHNNRNNHSSSSSHNKNKSSSTSTTSRSFNKASSSSTSSAPKSDLSDKLGKDGKLTSEERQRRKDNNLCLFCGKPGHSVKDCRAAASSSSSSKKGRAAQVSEKKPAEPKK